MKILITGGAGYIGSLLTPTLLAAGHEVTVLDNFLFRQASLLDCCQQPGFRIARGDCRDERILHRVAAQTTNADAVRLLCRLLSRQQLLMMPTSNSGYGIGEKDKFCTEESPLRPLTLYGRTKVEAEEAVLAHPQSISFRLATVFGLSPRMRLDLLVNDFVHRAVTDRAVVVFEGNFKRNYVHIRDVVRVFLHGIAHFESMKGRCYNVGLDEANLSKLELCAEIKKQVPQFVYLEAPIGEDPDKRDYIVSNARLAATGYRTEWTLERGIAELIKGYAILRNSVYANV